jgi:exonuclease SbcC
MAGFGAFKEPTDIDFDDVEFFALVGPTGSGKSTVIDAMCFALYGSVPRLDDRKAIAPVMSVGAVETKVALAFDIGADSYTAVRVVRGDARGKVSTKEARLEHRDGTILAGRESEMRSAVPALLGLDFDDFTRCVVLPQGEFARFLHQNPSDRQALLVRLLDLEVYARLASKANQRASAAIEALQFASGQRSGLRPHDDETRADAVARLAVATDLVQRAESAAGGAAALDAELRDVQAQSAAVERLGAALAAVEVPPGLVDRVGDLHTARLDVVRLEVELDAAHARVADAEAGAAALPAVPVLDALIQTHDRIVKGRTMIAAAKDAVADAERAHAEAAAAHRRQTDALEAAKQDLRAIDDAHRAHAVALTLEPGAPCPVCEQIVARLPLPVPPPGRDAALEREQTVASTLAAADRTLAGAIEALASARAALDQRLDLLDQLEAEVAGQPDRETAVALRTKAAEQTAALEAARAAERRVRDRVRAGQAVVRRLEEAVASDVAGYHRQRDPLTSDGAPAPLDDLADSWTELAAWARRRAAELEPNRAMLAARHEELNTQRSRLADELRCAFHAAGDSAPAGASIEQLVQRSAAFVTRAEVDVAAIDAAREAAVALDADIARLAAERAVAHELAQLLKADRFQRWLVESTLVDLAERATRTLFELSNGQFSLRYEAGDFRVVDHAAADETRVVRTLSGGETFQASLALALALADQLSDVGGRAHRRLESIFLDEGFGTLDVDSLETVAATIERLGGGGRMVGIVTHVRELADRVPVRYVVRRGPRTSTVERVGT